MPWLALIFKNKLFRQIGVVAIAALALFLAGMKRMADRVKTKKLKEALETHERVNDADVGKGDSDADRDWLRKRGGKS